MLRTCSRYKGLQQGCNIPYKILLLSEYPTRDLRTGKFCNLHPSKCKGT